MPAFRVQRPIQICLRPVLLALAVGLGCATGPAAADAPVKQTTQVPGYHRMTLGDVEVNAIYDGYVSLDTALLKGADPQDVDALLSKGFVPRDANGVQTAVNAFLINTGSNLVLVDAGAASCFGPTLGAINENIRSAGYDPAKIDAVLLTHLHGDHACGITNDGQMAFPNAIVYVNKDEAEFWLDKEKAAEAPQASQPFYKAAQDAVAPYVAAGKLKHFNGGDSLFPGIKSVPLVGHTAGHGGYLISSNGAQMLIWGDVIHSHAVQFTRPEVAIEFDSDPKQAIESRKQALADVAANKTWVGGAHLPFPGIGHVRKDETGYAWIPLEYLPLKPSGSQTPSRN